MAEDQRSSQRRENFARAMALLREVCDRGVGSLSALEAEGAAHRFTVAYELAWKALKDLLEADGTVVVPATPRNVIKEAYSAGLIDDGQTWIDMMLHRNRLSHTYDGSVLDAVLASVESRYYPALARLLAGLDSSGTA